MSNGIYEVFAEHNRKSANITTKVNRFVFISILKERIWIIDTKHNTQLTLKKATFKKIVKLFKEAEL